MEMPATLQAECRDQHGFGVRLSASPDAPGLQTQGVLEGHRQLPAQCSHLPRDELGFLGGTKRYIILVGPVCRGVLEYPLHVCALVSAGGKRKEWELKPGMDFPLLMVLFSPPGDGIREIGTREIDVGIKSARGSWVCYRNIRHESMMLEPGAARKRYPGPGATSVLKLPWSIPIPCLEGTIVGHCGQ